MYDLFDDFCILTLKEVYDGPVSPLCLPEINNNHYEKIDNAKIYGFGYTKYFGDKVRSWLTKKPKKQRIERKMHLSEGSYIFVKGQMFVNKPEKCQQIKQHNKNIKKCLL